MSNQYYIQDTRDYIGNALIWWRKGGGYTERIEEAQVFSENEALEITSGRNPHEPWLKSYIDNHTFKAVNSQSVTREHRGIKGGEV